MFAASIALALSSFATTPATPKTEDTPSTAPAAVDIVVVREQAGANAANAQPLVDELMVRLGVVVGWPQVKGRFFARLAAAAPWIAENKPAFAIASLPAFLHLRHAGQAKAIGEVTVTHAGGHRYAIVSSSAKDLAGCKGHRLVSDHLDDPTFIDSVVAEGAFSLRDFQVVSANRPVQTLKTVLRGEAECALIDDAQLATLPTLEGGKALHSVWTSDELPVLIIAVLHANAAQEKALVKTVAAVCNDQGKAICDKVGLAKLDATVSPRLTRAIKAYRPASP